jgi:hypothetical protein
MSVASRFDLCNNSSSSVPGKFKVMEEALASTVPPVKRNWFWPIFKQTLFVLVVFCVGQRAFGLWRESPPTPLHVDLRWLIPAAAIYLAGWLPSIWFWRVLLKRMSQRVGWYDAIRAHYVGGIGKYMPGKALVLVLRGTLLKDHGVNPLLAGLTSLYETLIFMSSGVSIAVALAPWALPAIAWECLPASLQCLRQRTLWVPMLSLLITIGITPLGANVFTLIGQKTLRRVPNVKAVSEFNAGLLVQGALMTSLGWCLHALSLGCTLQAVSDGTFNFDQFPLWLAAVCTSTVGGFVILIAPGGLGVREWILVEMLQDQASIGPTRAVAAAALLRAVWFSSELLAAGILYAANKTPRQDPAATD